MRVLRWHSAHGRDFLFNLNVAVACLIFFFFFSSLKSLISFFFLFLFTSVLYKPVFILLDPSIKADVDSWKVKLANYSSQFVGKTLVYLNGTFEECRFRECNLGNLICDAMVSHQSLFMPLDILGNSNNWLDLWRFFFMCIVAGSSLHQISRRTPVEPCQCLYFKRRRNTRSYWWAKQKRCVWIVYYTSILSFQTAISILSKSAQSSNT